MRMYKISFLFVFLYIILIGIPLKKEYSLNPGWLFRMNSDNVVTGEPGLEIRPFKLSNYFGYFSSGGVVYKDEILYDAAIDSNGFINYSSVNTGLVLKDTGGAVSGTIETDGYPFFTGGKRFIISRDGTSVTGIDDYGDELWSISFGSLVTDIAVNGDYVLAGTLSNGISLIEGDGKVVFKYVPDLSRINTVYGAAVNDNAENILVISGIDPQVVILLEKKGEGYRIIYTSPLDETLRRHRICGFFDDGSAAYLQSRKGFVLLDIDRKKSREIRLEGTLRRVVRRNRDSLLKTVSVKDGTVHFAAFRPDGSMLYRFAVEGDNPFLDEDGGSVYLGSDDYLLKMHKEDL